MEHDQPERRRIVVDGSNIATEGRSLPSLAQLDEAIRAFLEEYKGFATSDVTVVVDASFGHRIDPSEVAAFDQAIEHGEMITPPAGAVGRGDGFILRIAEKSGALVLSNDSFQEFHAERPWLFEPGRLIGGKPVPGVGWIFTPRTPVRGAVSRSVTSKSKREAKAAEGGGPEPAEATTGEASGGSRRSRGGRSKKAAAVEVAPAGSIESSEPTVEDDGAGGPAKATRATKATKATKADGPAKTTKATKATKTAKATKATKASKAAAAAKAAVDTHDADDTYDDIEPPRVASRAAKATKGTAAKAAKAAKAPRATKARKAAKASGTALAGTDGGTAEPPVAAASGEDDDGSGRRRAAAGEALNDALTFLTFVADHPVGSTFDGTVVSFTSHGAHVDVGGMLCHIPLRNLDDPPPNKARQVLTKGESRPFVLVSLDAPRRRAELTLPGIDG
jgi:hypothetical protein